MNLSRVKVWSAEILYAADLNAEFDNILSHEIADADCAANMALQGSKIKNADIDLTSKVKGILPVANGGTGVSGDTYDADKVDGIHAAASPTANRLVPLDANVVLPVGTAAAKVITTMIKTATGSQSGSTAGDITMNAYSFFPNVYASSVSSAMRGFPSSIGDQVGRFRITDAGSYAVRWRYITTSPARECWVVCDDEGNIEHCWESTGLEDGSCPFSSIKGKKIIKVDYESLEIEKVISNAKENKRVIAEEILKTFKVDVKTEKAIRRPQ